MDIQGKVVVVTGGASGIGKALCQAFALAGARAVVVADLDGAGAEAVAAGLGAVGLGQRTDVSSEAEVRALVDHTVERFGRLDVAVNNAGIEGQLGPLTEQSEDNFRSTFQTNVLVTLLALKHEMRVMLRQGAGAIVNLSSVAGQVGMAGASVYAASKHAVEGLTKSAALEGAAMGVRVNAVAPGPIQTDMLDRFTGGDEDAKKGFLASLPARRAGTPEEVAQAIVFLASDKARFLTGQCVAIDGGFTAQ